MGLAKVTSKNNILLAYMHMSLNMNGVLKQVIMK